MKKFALFSALFLLFGLCDCAKKPVENVDEYPSGPTEEEPAPPAEDGPELVDPEPSEGPAPPAHMHAAAGDRLFDAEKHWYVCADCGEKFSVSDHTMEGGMCTLCGYRVAEAFETAPAAEGCTVVGLGTVTSPDLLLPEEVDGKPVVGIAERAFAGESITSVTLPASLQTIGERAFAGCSGLDVVRFSSAPTVGADAFSGCKVSRVECEGLSVWQKICFAAPTSNPLFSGGRLFLGETEAEALSLSGEVLPYAFYGCISPKRAEMVRGTLGAECFAECAFLSDVTLGTDVTVGENAFEGTAALEEGGAEVYFGEHLIRYRGAAKRYEVRAGTKSIAGGAFEGNTLLERVTLPEGLLFLSERAFTGCLALQSISLPSSLLEIGAEAFSGCAALEAVSFPASLVRIGERAFSGSGLKSAAFSLAEGWTSAAGTVVLSDPLAAAERLKAADAAAIWREAGRKLPETDRNAL